MSVGPEMNLPPQSWLRKALLAIGVLSVVTLAGASARAGAEAPADALAGPFRVFKYARGTYGTAYLDDAGGHLSDSDSIEAPGAEPFMAEASAGVVRGDVSAAGVTTHDSSFDGRVLRMESHCDANANIADPKSETGGAACGNTYEIGFELRRPAKVTLDCEISSARTGIAGGFGEISLRDGNGSLIEGISSDNDILYTNVILAPGLYKLTATGSGGATAFFDRTFSAVTFDMRVALTARSQ